MVLNRIVSLSNA